MSFMHLLPLLSPPSLSLALSPSSSLASLQVLLHYLLDSHCTTAAMDSRRRPPPDPRAEGSFASRRTPSDRSPRGSTQQAEGGPGGLGGLQTLQRSPQQQQQQPDVPPSPGAESVTIHVRPLSCRSPWHTSFINLADRLTWVLICAAACCRWAGLRVQTRLLRTSGKTRGGNQRSSTR